jgi:transposase InsO family protein
MMRIREKRTDALLGRCSMARLCACVGISRQAHYQWMHRDIADALQTVLILEVVRIIRSRQAYIGGRKLYGMLLAQHGSLMQGVGRDAFFAILGAAGLLVHRRRRSSRTTYSQRWRRLYRNEIRDMVAAYPGHILVADITYLRLSKGFAYLALVTDLYSRKIVGYDVSLSLSLDGALRALRMALAACPPGRLLIHHSDHGLQYYSNEYCKEVEQVRKGIMSMTEDGNVYENAVAERVNGILKAEFALDQQFRSCKHAQAAVREAIEIYNHERPHMSLSLQTPSSVFANHRDAA